MTPKSPSAVLIHGLNLQTAHWKELVWGTEGLTQTGRISRGIEVAVKEGVDLIIWGTGASVDPETGKKEAEYTYSFALDHISELAAHVGMAPEELTAFIQQRSVMQLDTQNTKDEICEALKTCKEKDIHTLYLVSSPTHIARCLLTACQYQAEFPGVVLYGVAAETSTEIWSPMDVVVLEPSHRPDRANVPFNLLAKRMASSTKKKELAPKLYEDLKNVLDAFDEEVAQTTDETK